MNPRSKLAMLALLSVSIQLENDSAFRATMYKPKPAVPKSTLKQSEHAKRKSKNKSAKKARKQNRK